QHADAQLIIVKKNHAPKCRPRPVVPKHCRRPCARTACGFFVRTGGHRCRFRFCRSTGVPFTFRPPLPGDGHSGVVMSSFLKTVRARSTLALVAGLIGTLSLLAGCKKEASDAASDTLVIGLSLADLKEERWQRDRDFFVARAKALGAEVIVQDASGDPNAQLRQADGLLAKGVDVLVVVPKNADAARP